MKKYYWCINSLRVKIGFLKIVLVVTVMFGFTAVYAVKANGIKQTQGDTLTVSDQALFAENNEIISFTTGEELISISKYSTSGIPANIPAENIGYLVTVNKSEEKFRHVVTRDQELVLQLFQSYFNTNLDIVGILNNSSYFDIKTNNTYFYAEMGTVKEGKNGKLKFKKIKRSKK